MSSTGFSSGGGGGPTAPQSQQYYCYQCEQTVTITPTSEELVCPSCGGGFLEEIEPTATDPTAAATIPPMSPFFSTGTATATNAHPFGGFPILFSSSTNTNNNPFTDGGALSIDDLSAAILGAGPTRSPPHPNEFNPFSFLQNYFNTLRSSGANIQLVIEGGGNVPIGAFGIGGGLGDFRLPANFGDYFIGPGLEQLIQQLAENDPNRYGTPPASKTAVEGLPSIVITEELMSSDSSQCAVCKDSFELNEEVKQMPCKHIYHKDCILPWLEMHNSCPVCRYELPTDDPDYENRRTNRQTSNVSNNIGVGGNNASNNENVGIGGIGMSIGGDQENAGQSPRAVERRFRISLPPWLFRGFGGQAESSSSGGAAGGNEGGNNSNSNNNNNARDNRGGSNTGSGGQAREEALD